MKKLAMTGIVILVSTMALFGLVVWNHSDSAYDSGDDGVKIAANFQLGTMITAGAGEFLKANACFQQLLYQVEVAELYGANFPEMRRLINEAITSLESARTTYGEIKDLAAQTPYNPDIISKLKYFNYIDLCYKNKLNIILFSRVVSFLSIGNVTGVYKEIYTKTGDIAALMSSIKQQLDKDLVPDIKILWQANQLYADTLLFGQYIAMVFRDIL